MELTSRDGASVRLSIDGYQFPALQPSSPPGPRDWDANWLVVRGDIGLADGKTWSFTDPCLTTWEARALGQWLRDVAAGGVPPSPPGRPELMFTEPCLAFSLEDRIAGRVRVKAVFGIEALPPWRQGTGRPELNEFAVVLDAPAAQVALAARQWLADLAGFPER